jgi:hypothetical protein
MRVACWIIAAVVAGTVPVAVAAESREAGQYRFSVTPMVGYRMGGSFEDEQTGEEIDLDDDASFGVIINAPFDSVGADAYTEWEFYYSRQSVGVDDVPAGLDPSLELDIDYYLLGGTYVGPGDSVRPFLAAEIGAATVSPDGPDYDSDTVFAFSIGGGAQISPARRIGLRIEGRALAAVVDSDSALFCQSGPAGSACAFRANGDLLWQWEISAGATFRF